MLTLIGSGMALADDCKYPHVHAYGHYKQKVHHYYAPPRPVYVEHHHYPVVVDRHVYHPPVRYLAPAPEGFFFGMSMFDAGTAFSFGVSGR